MAWHCPVVASWPSTAFPEPINGGFGNWRVDALTPSQDIPLVLDVNEVLEDHLRSPDPYADSRYASRLLRTAQELAQAFTKLAVGTQDFALVLDATPTGDLELPFGPVTAVTTFAYLDGDGAEQTWGGSPLPYEVSLPAGPRPSPARVRAIGGSWPTTGTNLDAVRVEYTAGFTEATVPGLITQGMLLIVGELFKQRSESVHAFNQAEAVVRARTLWSRLKVY